MRSALETCLKNFHSDESGASAIEWAVLASCIIAMCVLTIGGMGQSLLRMYDQAVTIIGSFL